MYDETNELKQKLFSWNKDGEVNECLIKPGYPPVAYINKLRGQGCKKYGVAIDFVPGVKPYNEFAKLEDAKSWTCAKILRILEALPEVEWEEPYKSFVQKLIDVEDRER